MAQLAQSIPDVIGTVSPPPGVQRYNSMAGNDIGIIMFISTLIDLATIVAGIWIMFNFVLAGYDYITSNGDTGAHNRVKDRLTMSMIGIVLISSTYLVAGLIGYIAFGDASYILNPRIVTL